MNYNNIYIEEYFTDEGEPSYIRISDKFSEFPIKEEFYKNGMLVAVVERFSNSLEIKKTIKYGFFKKIEQIIYYRKNGNIRTIKTFSGNKMKIDDYDNDDEIISSEIYTLPPVSHLNNLEIAC